MERITFNLTEKASNAIVVAMEMTESNKTDVLNKAVQVYALLLRSSTVYVKETEDGPLERVHIF